MPTHERLALPGDPPASLRLSPAALAGWVGHVERGGAIPVIDTFHARAEAAQGDIGWRAAEAIAVEAQGFGFVGVVLMGASTRYGAGPSTAVATPGGPPDARDCVIDGPKPRANRCSREPLRPHDASSAHRLTRAPARLDHSRVHQLHATSCGRYSPRPPYTR